MEINVMKIKVLLAERLMTQAELASKSGIARTNMSALLSRGRCSLVTAGKISAALGVPVSEIVKGAK